MVYKNDKNLNTITKLYCKNYFTEILFQKKEIRLSMNKISK